MVGLRGGFNDRQNLEGVKANGARKDDQLDDVIEDDSYMDDEDPWIVLATSADTGGPHTL